MELTSISIHLGAWGWGVNGLAKGLHFAWSSCSPVTEQTQSTFDKPVGLHKGIPKGGGLNLGRKHPPSESVILVFWRTPGGSQQVGAGSRRFPSGASWSNVVEPLLDQVAHQYWKKQATPASSPNSPKAKEQQLFRTLPALLPQVLSSNLANKSWLRRNYAFFPPRALSASRSRCQASSLKKCGSERLRAGGTREGLQGLFGTRVVAINCSEFQKKEEKNKKGTTWRLRTLQGRFTPFASLRIRICDRFPPGVCIRRAMELQNSVKLISPSPSTSISPIMASYKQTARNIPSVQFNFLENILEIVSLKHGRQRN